MLVEGEAGIGKTRLLEEALTGAAARGMQAAAGRAEELERARPFGLLADAFGCEAGSRDSQRAAIAELLTASDGSSVHPVTVTSDPGLQFRVVDAFGDLVETLALSGPAVIGADDLQWADPSSLLTVAAMARRLPGLPVAIIGCFRPVPRGTELDALIRALQTAGARQLTLPPLGAEAVRELACEAVAAEPGHELLGQIAGTAGNPLFLTELLGALLQEGAIQVAGGRAEIAQARLPPSLRLTILRRISFLPEDTIQLLQVASVLGSAFSLTDLALISDRPVIELTTALTEAIRARIIGDDGIQLRFRHDLIRDAVYEDLPASVRRGLHRETALRLANAGAPALRVAEHFTRGASEGDVEAIVWLTRAARGAASGSPAIAAALLDRAISLLPPGNRDRDQLLAERAGSLMLAGRITEAETLCRQLLGRPHDPAVEVAARMCLGRALLAQGRERDGLAEMERVAASPGLSDAEHGAARASASFARLSLGDLEGADNAARQAISAASAASDLVSASQAMASRALVRESLAQLDAARQIVDDAMRLTDESVNQHGSWYVHIARANILVRLDRLEDARATLHASQRTFEELGIRWPLPSIGVSLGLERFLAGEWDDALAELESGLELAEEIGETYSMPYAHGVMSLISVHRNDLDRAAVWAEAASRELADRGPQYRISWAAWPQALVLEAHGQRTQALGTMIAAWDDCSRLGITVEYPAMGAGMVRLAMAEGDAARARQAASAVADVASYNDVTWLRGAALQCQGLAEEDAGLLVFRTLFTGWGVTIPAGGCPEVGAGGHFAGGGYGPLSRRYGSVVDHLYGVEVVVVGREGIPRVVEATREPGDPNSDLWWAHTGGGGGNFGVVTRYWLRSPGATGTDASQLLPPTPGEMLESVVVWAWDQQMTQQAFSALLRNFGIWHERNSAPGSPCTGLYAIMIPLQRSAGRIMMVVQINAGIPGADTVVTDFVSAITAGSGVTPAVNTRGTLPWLHATTWPGTGQAGDVSTRRYKIKAAYLRRSFTEDQLATIYQYLNAPAGPSGGGMLLVGYGGQVQAVAPDATATAQRDVVMKAVYQTVWADESGDAANLTWIRDFYRDVYRDTGGVPVPNDISDGSYINYPDNDLADPAWNTSGVPWSTLYYKGNYPRLQQVKARWDPANVFQHTLGVEPRA